MRRLLVLTGLAVMLALPCAQGAAAQEAPTPGRAAAASAPADLTSSPSAVQPPSLPASAPSQPPLQSPSALPSQLPLIRSAPEAGLPSSWLAGWLFLGVLVLIAGFLVRRRGIPALLRHWKLAARPGTRPGVIPLSSQTLRPGVSVHVVRWRGEDLLLGCTAQQVTLLASKPNSDTDPDPDPDIKSENQSGMERASP